jgi:group I intron endonuclease
MNAQIYLVENRLNGKPYIGQTINPHFPIGHGRLLKAAYKKYGKENFTYQPILTGITHRQTLNCMERFWISIFNSVAPNGYNLESGGSDGQEWTPERRKAHTEAKIGRKLNRPLGSKSGMKGKKYPEEGKRKLSKVLKGRPCPTKGIPHSEETKAKMSESQKARAKRLGENHPNRGQKHSDETKAKMSLSRTGRTQSLEERKMRSASIKLWHQKRKEQTCQ